MAKPLRIGVIGTGFISDWLCEAARASGGSVISAVCSREPERGRAFAQKQCIGKYFSEEEAFFSCPDIDAVYVASPNCAHYRQTMAALAHGKHVLCEKPFAINAAQAERMIALAHERGLTLLEAIRPVYDPFIAVLRENVHKAGRIRRATFEFCQYSSRYGRYLAGEHVNVFDSSLGNAAMLDLGVYCLHVCVALFGMPRKLSASSSFLENGTEVAGTMLLDYQDQQTTISYSKVTSSVHPSMVQGEQGTLVCDTLNQPGYLRMLYRDGRTEELFTPQYKNNMTCELDVFARMAQTGASTAEYDEQSLRVMRLLDEARRQTGIDFGNQEKT